MADETLPTCMIASSGRFHDLKPYCDRIYHNDPDTWDSIFPWEFPQHASREAEETFLDQYFGKREVHMQGGATGDGEGYKFLKQVWYCIAMYNLDIRIPAFTRWWLAKPNSVELLADVDMRPFFFAQDVAASTFFADELPSYGEKFLTTVIPYLQKTAKEMLEAQEIAEKQALVVDTKLAQQSVKSEAEVDGEPTSALPTVPEAPEVQSAPILQPKQTVTTAAPATDVPQSAPLLPSFDRQAGVPSSTVNVQPTSSAPAQSRLPFPPNAENGPRKSGNGGGRRFSNQNHGSFKNRQASSFNERNAQTFHPPPTHGHPRQPSEGPSEFFPSMSQGQSLPTISPQSRFMVSQYGQPMGATLHQHMAQNMYYEPGPQQHVFNHPFADRSNQQHAMHAFNGEQQQQQQQQMPPFQDRHPQRGNLHRNSFSQGTRGAKSRGVSVPRGRGGRGRDNFAMDDRSRPNTYGENIHPDAWPDPLVTMHQPGHRRGSVIQERNWRSGSDDPQAQQAEHPMQDHALIGPQPAPFGQPFAQVSYPQFPVYATEPPQEKDIERVSIPNKPYQGNMATPPKTRAPSAQHLPDPTTMTEEQACGPGWIGKDCTYATRLIAFNVPPDTSHDYLNKFFNKFGRTKAITRPISGQPSSKLLFVEYWTAAEARACLLNKPNTWLNDQPCLIEVSRSIWDTSHPRYIFNRERSATMTSAEFSPPAARVPSILKRAEGPTPKATDANQARRAMSGVSASVETTPTPSGVTTPKKGKKSKAAKKRKQEDQRIASASAKLEQHARTASTGNKSDAASVVTVINDPQGEKQSKTESSKKREEVPIETVVAQNQPSVSEQTEGKNTFKPSATPTDIVRTELSVPQDRDLAIVVNKSPIHAQRSASGQTEVQTASEPSFTPTDAITRLPESDGGTDQSFREDEKTEEKAPPAELGDYKEASTSELVESKAHAPNMNPSAEESQVELPAFPTPVKSNSGQADDSFHTASDSPDTVKGAETMTEGLAIDTGLAVSQEGDNTAVKITLASPRTIDQPTIYDDEEPSPKTLPANEGTLVAVNAGKKPKALQVPQLDDSSLSPALPTPAFFTAPNTPAVTQDTPTVVQELPSVEEEPRVKIEASVTDRAGKPTSAVVKDISTAEEEEAKTESTPPKKVDKQKGPAQTESLSLFGKKKKDKKPKGAKKATIKGKPKGMDVDASSEVANGSVSRVASGGTVTPTLEAAKEPQKGRGRKSGREDMSGINSRFPDKGHRTGPVSETAESEGSVTPTPDRDEKSPSKRKGLGSIFSGFFTGGQHSSSAAKSSHGPPSPPAKNVLTDEKAQGPPQEIDHRVRYEKREDVSPAGDEERLGSVATELSHDLTPLAAGLEGIRQVEEELKQRQRAGSSGKIGEDASTAVTGLGISTTEADFPTVASTPTKKQGGSSTQTAIEDQDKSSASPDEIPRKLSDMYRFGQGSSTGSPGSSTVTPQPLNATVEDDNSEASSTHTLARDGTPTSSSGMRSPTSSSLSGSRKLAPHPAGEGHLVQSKTQNWKKKRRHPHSYRNLEDEDEEREMILSVVDARSETSDERTVVVAADEDEEVEETVASPNRLKKVYLYCGPKTQDEGGDGGEDDGASQSQQLAQSSSPSSTQHNAPANTMTEINTATDTNTTTKTSTSSPSANPKSRNKKRRARKQQEVATAAPAAAAVADEANPSDGIHSQD